MSNSIRYHVIAEICNLFKGEREKLERQLAEARFGYQIYMRSLPEEVRKAIDTMQKFDPDWIRTTTNIQVSVSASPEESESFFSYEERSDKKVPYCGYGYNARVTLHPGCPEYSQVESIINRYREINREQAILKVEVQQLVTECKTVEDLCTIWHTASLFLPEDVRVSNKQRKNKMKEVPKGFSDEAATILMRQLLMRQS